MTTYNGSVRTMLTAEAPTPPRRITEGAGAVLLVSVPTLFTAAFTALSMRFDYPQILRQPAGDVLTRFHQSEAGLLPLWWGMFAAALLFGTLAGIVQALGLARWIFLVPFLASAYAAPDATDATRDTARLLFESFHQFFGVGIGEWLGYLFTGLWTLLVGGALWKGESGLRGGRLWGGAGVVFGLGILAGLLEVFGIVVAGAVNAIAYLLWSLWLIALGVGLLLQLYRSRVAAPITL